MESLEKFNWITYEVSFAKTTFSMRRSNIQRVQEWNILRKRIVAKERDIFAAIEPLYPLVLRAFQCPAARIKASHLIWMCAEDPHRTSEPWPLHRDHQPTGCLERNKNSTLRGRTCPITVHAQHTASSFPRLILFRLRTSRITNRRVNQFPLHLSNELWKRIDRSLRSACCCCFFLVSREFCFTSKNTMARSLSTESTPDDYLEE